jgi:LAO/AO transport system kinase
MTFPLNHLLAGDARTLARALTEVENDTAEGRALLRALYPRSGRARTVGVTGAPGAGKSSLVDRLAAELRRENLTAGILAVDPTSPFSGGAILGDRIRMQAHASDPGIFIRSMATRGALGGLARTTADLALVLDAAGRDVILIETVGVGQDEVDVARVAQVVAVVLVPGMGDDVQALKAGILEIADVLVINKSDRDGADRLEQELRAMLELAHRPDAWTPPIVRTVATESQGIRELWTALRSFPRQARAAAHWRHRLRELLRDRLLERLISPAELEQAAAEVAAGRLDPYAFLDARLAPVSLDHLGIAVASVEAALPLYRDLLGLTVSGREEVSQERVRAALLPAGDSRLELLEATSPDSPIARFLARRGPGLHHLALRVPDLQAALDRLRAAGVRLVTDTIQCGAGGHRYIFIHPAAAGGVLVELVEAAKERE